MSLPESRVINYLGIDASMCNIGLVHGQYSLSTGTYKMVDLHLIQTFPSKDKKVRKSSQDYDRCREAHTKLNVFLVKANPTICFAEMPTGSQNAAAMKSYGISIMLLASIPSPVIQVSPQEVKAAATGSKTSSKDTMIKWAVEKWPELPWLRYKQHGQMVLNNKNEHLADACGAVAAGALTDQWLQLISVLKGQQGV